MIARRLVLGLALALASCGGGEAAPPDATLTGADGHPEPCNPVAQGGCDPGEKCAPLRFRDDPALTRLECVPAGAAQVGEPCARGPAGAQTGYDDCAGGAVCVAGTCAEVCLSHPDTCSAGGAACVALPALFGELGAETGGGACLFI